MEKPAPKYKRGEHIEYVEPVFLRKLLDAEDEDFSQVAEMLNLSVPFVRNASTGTDKWRQIFEYGAENIYMKKHGGGRKQKVAIVLLDGPHMETIETLVRNLSGKIKIVD